MNAVAFDLGDTLIEYAGLPPSWEAHYDAALKLLAEFVGCTVSDQELSRARQTLRKYNTRLNPRTREVPFSAILAELMLAFRAKTQADTDAAAAVFFSVFRQRLRCFPETPSVLRMLRSTSVRIGVLTDVPYGMPRALVAQDLVAAGVSDLIDELVTSVDAQARKPKPDGLELLARRLESTPSEMLFVGNERKDVEVALSFGCQAVLLDRLGAAPNWGQHHTVTSLLQL